MLGNNPHANESKFNLPILHKTYELYKIFYNYSKYFPKKDRYVFGQRCENLMLDIIELIFRALCSDKEEKLRILKITSTKLNVLRILIRLLKDIGIFDLKRYIILQKEINNIGVLLGSWIKNLKQKGPDKGSF